MKFNPTITEVANKLGVSKEWISQIINGNRVCKKETKEAISKFYPNIVWEEINKPKYRVSQITITRINK